MPRPTLDQMRMDGTSGDPAQPGCRIPRGFWSRAWFPHGRSVRPGYRRGLRFPTALPEDAAVICGPSSQRTLSWREMDSNFRSPVKRTTFSRLPNWIRQFRGKRLRIRWQPPESRNRLSGSMLHAAPCNFSCPHKQQSSAGALKAQGRAAMPSSGRTGCPLQRRVLPGPARQPLIERVASSTSTDAGFILPRHRRRR
jgi:hypothetical protein